MEFMSASASHSLWLERHQHVKDAAIAAGASFSALVLLQRVLLVDAEQQDSLTMALLLFCMLLLQIGGTWWTKDEQNATTMQFLAAAQSTPGFVGRAVGNAVCVLLQCYVRVDTLHHFGFLFAFLLEQVDSLLLQPMMDAVHSPSTSPSDGHATWLLVLLGYVLVAGVDAYEYGSLLHPVLLIALTLATRLAQNRMAETKMRLTTIPHFNLATLAIACTLLLPVSLLGFQWRPQRDTILSPIVSSPGSAVWWIAYLVGAASCHLLALYFTRNAVPKSLSRERWLTLIVCSSMGLGGSVLISICQDDWLRIASDGLASLVIILAQLAQFRAASKSYSSLPTHSRGSYSLV